MPPVAAAEQTVRVGSLLVVTGPPGAGKSSVARVLADSADRSVLVEGDAFFGFLASGAVEPWLPESKEQNTVVTRAAASTAGQFANGGYTTVYDGVVGPWFLPTFAAATGLDHLDYVMLLPSVETCVQRVASRRDHGFTDEPATRKMHSEFARAEIADRHVLRELADDVGEVEALVQAALSSGRLRYEARAGVGLGDEADRPTPRTARPRR
jgi:dephospho-CoA kinase